MISRISVGSGGFSIDCASAGIRARSRARAMPRGPTWPAQIQSLASVRCFCQRFTSRTVILQGAIAIAVIRIIRCTHIELVQDHTDYLRSSKMQPLQGGFDYSSSRFARTEHEQSTRRNARKQWRIGQAQNRRRINDDEVEIFAGGRQQSGHVLTGQQFCRVGWHWSRSHEHKARNIRRLQNVFRSGSAYQKICSSRFHLLA